MRENWITYLDREDFYDDVDMVFGLDKCAMLALRTGKMVWKERIELPDGKQMREVNLDGYYYLGVLQLYSIMNKEIKENAKTSE